MGFYAGLVTDFRRMCELYTHWHKNIVIQKWTSGQSNST